MEQFLPYLPYAVVALGALVLLEFLLIVSLSGRITRLSRTVRGVLLGPNGEDLETMLTQCLNESSTALQRNDETLRQVRALADEMRHCIQQIGVVRYDAYGDVSGSQSFSLALLDGNANGVVISGLLSRSDGRCYSKTILGGQPEQTLSNEEQQALDMALGGGLKAQVATTAANSNGRGRRSLFNRA